MLTLRYYRVETDEDAVTDVAYMEFAGEWVARQVNVYDGRFYPSDIYADIPDVGPALCDQSLSSLREDEAIGPAQEIAREEFEKVWSEAHVRQPVGV